MNDLESRIVTLRRKELKLNLARHVPYFYTLLRPVLASLFYENASQQFFENLTSPNAVVGLVIAGCGVVLSNVLKRRSMKPIVDNYMKDTTDQQMIETGAYSVNRNPFYTAQTVAATGMVIVSPTLDSLASFIAYLGLTEATVRTEEKKNLLQFGDKYRSYMNRVPRWLRNPVVSLSNVSNPN